VLILSLHLSGSWAIAQNQLDPADRLTRAADHGAVILEERCSECHDANRVDKHLYDYTEWNHVIDQMMKKKDNLLTTEERTLLLDYLILRTELNRIAQQEALRQSPTAAQPVAPEEKRPLGVVLFGRFHLLVLHFPIAFVSLVALLELIFLFRQPPAWYEHIIWGLLGIAIVSAIVTSASGVIYATERGHQLLNSHKNLGILSTLLIGIATGIRFLDLRFSRYKSLFWYRILIFGSALLVGITAHLGGTMVHGERFRVVVDPIKRVLEILFI